MASRVHLVVVDEGDYGWSATSPQIPGFVYGRPTREEFQADLPGALAFAGASDATLVIHDVRRFAAPDGQEYLIRVAEDEHRGERTQVAWLLSAMLAKERHHDLLDAPTTITGEVQFICVVESDRVSWLLEQLDQRRDAATIVAGHSSELIWATWVAHGVTEVEGSTGSLAELEVSLDSTVSDLMARVPSQSRIPVLV